MRASIKEITCLQDQRDGVRTLYGLTTRESDYTGKRLCVRHLNRLVGTLWDNLNKEYSVSRATFYILKRE